MSQRAPRFLVALLLATMTAMLFASLGLGGDFILDDGINILQNHLLYVEQFNLDEFIYAALSFHDGNGSRSLPMLSFALDYWRIGSMDATAFKLTNIIIHGVTTFFLAFFFNRLLLLAGWASQSAWHGALLLALVWGLHPIQVSSVLYIVQRMQTLATLFLVLSLWAYLAMRQAQLDGLRGRSQGVLVIVFWLLAMLCKEDAILLVAYTLVLELTLLRFRAGLPVVAKGLRQSYALMVVLGLLAYALVIVPHFWHWDSYYARDFSTPERLLTQGRVLVMYLGQILLPWPDFFSFNYDNYEVSRSLWQPWSTLPGLMLLLALLIWAWRWRIRRPLFACGVLLFFAGHFVSSNVIGLEMVFEHRNNFPLIGAILAIADLLHGLARAYALPACLKRGFIPAVMLALAAACSLHLHTWSDPARHGKKMTEQTPGSSRAWAHYSGVYFKQYNKSKELGPLKRSVEILEQGMLAAPSPSLAANLITNKSILGTLGPHDWHKYLYLLQQAEPARVHTMSVQQLMLNTENGYIKEPAQVLAAIEILNSKPSMQPIEPLKVAVFAYTMGLKEEARTWFIHYARQEPAGSLQLGRTASELEAAGYLDWAQQMRAINQIDK